MSAPFSVCLLSEKDPVPDPSTVFPATYRSDKGQVTALTAGSLQFFEKELQPEELNKIQDALWAAGLPTPPRHLAHQIVLSREIVVTEQIGLHLVWKDKRMYLKPLSKYLLVPSTWSQHFKSQQGDDQQTADHRQALAACARGFLRSYCALIAYESDFQIAKRLGLLPEEIPWPDWRRWTAEVLQNCPESSLNPRFWYGELRLGRLNIIYRLKEGALLRGYSRVGSPSVYSELLGENFTVLAVALGYVVIVLTAMQVGLATDHLHASSAFQGASWGFTVFSIIAPLAAVASILIYFVAAFVMNWQHTLSFEKKRSKDLGFDVRNRGVVKDDEGV